MSGVAGGTRPKREEIQKTVDQLVTILNEYEYFDKVTKVEISGSYNSDLTKQDFGDIDLIVNFNPPKGMDKTKLKTHFIEWLLANHKKSLLPFGSAKYKGRFFYNSGELVSILFPIAGRKNEGAQVDIIFSVSKEEANFKKQFLDLPAEKQGLVLGLIKTILLEEQEEAVFKILKIPHKKLPSGKEYDLTLSSSGLTIEIVDKFDPNKKSSNEKKLVTKIVDWNVILKLLDKWKIGNVSFSELLNLVKATKWKSDRSLKRLVGIFKSMISIKSGEVGTPKGDKKQEALDQISTLLENKSFEYYLGMVYNEHR